MKKANNEQPEKDLQCQAELCGRENRLNALGRVAIYLADASREKRTLKQGEKPSHRSF